MKRTLIAGLSGGLIVFVWGALSWMALPYHVESIDNLPHEAQAVSTFLEAIPESGMYHYPGLPPADATAQQREAWEARVKAGPRIPLMICRVEGSDPLPAENFFFGFAGNLAAALLAAGLLGVTALRSYGSRVLFVTLLGGFASLSSVLPNWTWWSFTGLYGTLEIGDLLIGWCLAGLAIAKIIRPS